MSTPTPDPPWLTWLTIPPAWCGRDVQAAHRTIAHGVDGAPHLWCRPDRRLLIVQTDKPLAPEAVGATSARSLPVRLDYQPGEPVVASLIANPTVDRSRPGARSHREAIREPVERDGWLRRKLDGAVHVDRVTQETLGQQGGDRHGHRVVHLQVGYTVWGTVTDPGRLAGLLRDGVGRARRYGCGLLLMTGAGS